MSEPIPATTPTVLPALPERVYDLWRIILHQVSGLGTPEDPLQLHVVFRKYRVLPDGAIELGPEADNVVLDEPDLNTLIEGDATGEYARAFDAALAASVTRARDLGLL